MVVVARELQKLFLAVMRFSTAYPLTCRRSRVWTGGRKSRIGEAREREREAVSWSRSPGDGGPGFSNLRYPADNAQNGAFSRVLSDK